MADRYFTPAEANELLPTVRPLVEQVFRWQQRIEGAAAVVLRLELESDHLDWFPGRLRHIGTCKRLREYENKTMG